MLVSAVLASSSVLPVGQQQPPLPAAIVALLAVIAIGAVLLPDLWLVTRHVAVMAHEGAHATVGSAVGRRIQGVTFHRNGDGGTQLSSGGAAGTIVATVAGYLGPSGFGLGAAGLISAGHGIAVLWAGIAALALLMIPLRRSFGVLTVLCAFIALLALAGFATATTQVAFSYGLTWFLLASGVRMTLEHGTSAADAHILRSLTRIPNGFWSRIWLLGSLAALGLGAVLLF